MSPEERLAEVLRRTAVRLPRATGDELLALVTPESVAAALGLALFGAAANLTPFGWTADVVLAAIAFGFGGLAAVQALGDLVTCVERIADADSERDLDAAAEALARAASTITVAGLAAILHEKARRWGGQAEDARADRADAPTRSSRKTGGEPAGGRSYRAEDGKGLLPKSDARGAGTRAPGHGGGETRSHADRHEAGDRPQKIRSPGLDYKAQTSSTFISRGISQEDASNFLRTEGGKAMIDDLRRASRDADDATIRLRALDQVMTGSDLPVRHPATQRLVKIVPQGSQPNSYTPFFTTMDQVDAARRSGRSLADYFALPRATEAATYDLYEIEPMADAHFYSQAIAPSAEMYGDVERAGGGLQCLVPDRSKWSTPTKAGSLSDGAHD